MDKDERQRRIEELRDRIERLQRDAEDEMDDAIFYMRSKAPEDVASAFRCAEAASDYLHEAERHAEELQAIKL